jgi:hypothetical protein
MTTPPRTTTIEADPHPSNANRAVSPALTVEQDEALAEELRARLVACFGPARSESLLGTGEPDFFGLIYGVAAATNYVWPIQASPLMVVAVAGRYTWTGVIRTPLPISRFWDLGERGLADPDDYFVMDCSRSRHPLIVLQNLELVRSQLRWLAPDGGRHILVLPSEYDA